MNGQYKNFCDRFMALYEVYSDSTFLDYYRFNAKINNTFNHPYFMIDVRYIKLFLDEIFANKKVIYGVDFKGNYDELRDLKCDNMVFMHIFEMVKYQFRKHWLYREYSDKKNILDSELSWLDLSFAVEERIIKALKSVYGKCDESTRFSVADLMVIDEEVLKYSLSDVASVNSTQAIRRIKNKLAVHNLYLYDVLPSEKMTIVDCIKNNLYKDIKSGKTPTSIPLFGNNVNIVDCERDYIDIDDALYALGILYSDELIGELLDITKETVLNFDKTNTFMLRKKLGVFDNGKRCKNSEIDRCLNIRDGSSIKIFNKQINSGVRHAVEKQIPLMTEKKQHIENVDNKEQEIIKLNMSARLFNRLYSNNIRYISDLKNITIEELENDYDITRFFFFVLLNILKDNNINLKEKLNDSENDLNNKTLSEEDAHIKKLKCLMKESIWKKNTKNRLY